MRQILVILVDLVLVAVAGAPVQTKMPTLVLVEEGLVPTKMLMLEPQQQQQQQQQPQQVK